jgi:hypothetical protein
MEVQIYYTIWKFGGNLSQISLCEVPQISFLLVFHPSGKDFFMI